jgi:hypothetical protein
MKDKPAFPCDVLLEDPGMTLREYYAGLAMQGYLAGGDYSEIEFHVEKAVQYADALIKQLDNEKEKNI